MISRMLSAISQACVSSAEMASVKEADNRVRVIALERLCTRRRKYGWFLPHTAKNGGWCARKYSWNVGYSAMLLR